MSPIKNLSPDEKPREKLLEHGATSLSDAELLAILIGSGNRELNAVELCREILKKSQFNLDLLASSSVEELQQFKGIGEAKAISIVSALELSRRRKKVEPKKVNRISSSRDIYNMLHPYLMDLSHEEFWLIALNRSNKVLKISQVSKGGVSATIVDPKMIFKQAMDLKACAIVVAHNHPSNTPQPSPSDIALTRKLKEGGKLLEISLLDHVIYTNNGYFSFLDENML